MTVLLHFLILQPFRLRVASSVLRAVQIGVFSIASVALAVVNAQSIMDLIRFGLEYYPRG